MASPDKLGRRIASLVSGDTPQYIRAYHGSPYDFDRFDASKIGTGEGAQAYGHGLYFAGAEGTARHYRESLKGLAPAIETDETRALLEAVAESQRTMHTLYAQMKDLKDYGAWRALASQLEDARNASDDAMRRYHETQRQNPGRMYEVELGVPSDAFLDWDRPLSTKAGAIGAALVRDRNPAAMPLPVLRAIEDGSWRFESFPDRNPYEGAAYNIARTAKSAAGAKALLEAGVPGVRYLDGNSRNAGAGSRNYVMFPGTEDHIRILRKYGLLAPMALPALQEGE